MFYMRETMRRIFVTLLAVAFVFSGVAWAACIEQPQSLAGAETVLLMSANQVHSHSVFTNHSSQAENDNLTSTSNNDSLPDHGLAPVVKCCSMAPAFSLSSELAARPVDFPRSVVAFRFVQRGMAGNIVALEPGIPKPIV